MVDFPRGGSSTLSQLEIRDIQDQVVTESIVINTFRHQSLLLLLIERHPTI